VRDGDERLGTVTSGVDAGRIVVPLPALKNGQDSERRLWSPEHPVLLDALIELLDENGTVIDEVASYFGLRSLAVAGGEFLLNGRPHRIAGVLSQGFWPESHLAAPSTDALRAEVQLIKDLGFTTARIHQKIEDPRFLFWADRLGLLVWTELPSAYVFSDVAAQRLTSEWLDVVRRDRSHPSVVAWVPFNESWGVDRMAVDAQQQQLVRGLYHLTKAVDPTRPVISNDGWEHTESDLLTIHDYENDPAVLAASYGSAEATAASIDGIAPSGRRTFVGEPIAGLPVVLSEFGGVSVTDQDGGWGYRMVPSVEALETQLSALFDAVRAAGGLKGWCFTQLTDTAQETNGLTDEHRVPKLPIERLRAIVTGR
jgi:hypothetical protein